MPPSSTRLLLKPAQLRLITQIAELGQLQMAADAVAMTPPAASRMLAEIEKQIGAPLFQRLPKGMKPTEIGRAVLRRAQVILREMASMNRDVSALREGFAGSVRIGAVTGPAVASLVTAIREIKQQSPEADITVDVLPSRELLEQLLSGAMDFALARILPEYDSRDFDILPMRDEQVKFVARAAHPLARAEMVTLTELSSYEWIMQQRGAPVREAALAAFANVGLAEPASVINSPSPLFTIAYLAQTDAISPLADEVAHLLI